MLFEWHITPDYIVTNWTDELLLLMTDKLVERKNRETNALSRTDDTSQSVSPETLAAMSNGMIKVEKKHGD